MVVQVQKRSERFQELLRGESSVKRNLECLAMRFKNSSRWVRLATGSCAATRASTISAGVDGRWNHTIPASSNRTISPLVTSLLRATVSTCGSTRWSPGPASEIFCSSVREFATPCRASTRMRRRPRQGLPFQASPLHIQAPSMIYLITTQAKRNLSSRSGIGGVLSAT